MPQNSEEEQLLLARLDISAKQLDRILGFFPRVESKASFLFAVNSAMIGALSVNIQRADLFSLIHMTLAVLSMAALIVSLFFIYQCTFPNLAGGHSSMIYFREIAKQRETEYVGAFKSLSNDRLLEDLTSQTWRNAEILAAKFTAMKRAFVVTALALAPWSLFLIVASITHSQFPVIK
jgi:hypothetical protein